MAQEPPTQTQTGGVLALALLRWCPRGMGIRCSGPAPEEERNAGYSIALPSHDTGHAYLRPLRQCQSKCILVYCISLISCRSSIGSSSSSATGQRRIVLLQQHVTRKTRICGTEERGISAASRRMHGCPREGVCNDFKRREGLLLLRSGDAAYIAQCALGVKQEVQQQRDYVWLGERARAKCSALETKMGRGNNIVYLYTVWGITN